MVHITNGGNVTVTTTESPSVGDFVELNAQFNADGSIKLTQSINADAETATTQSAALNPAQSWDASTIWFNSRSTASVGRVGLMEARAMRGIKSLQEMRNRG